MLFSGAMAGEDKTHCAYVCAFDSIVVSVCCCSCTSSSSWLPTGGHWQLSRHCWLSEEENVLIWPESFSSGAAGDKRWSNQEEEEEMRAPGQGRVMEERKRRREREKSKEKPIKTNGRGKASATSALLPLHRLESLSGIDWNGEHRWSSSPPSLHAVVGAPSSKCHPFAGLPVI